MEGRVRTPVAAALLAVVTAAMPAQPSASDQASSPTDYRSDEAVVGIHRVAIGNTPPQSIRPAVRTIDRRGADPLGVAIDDSRGRIYWTEHAGGKIRSARLDGSDLRDEVGGGIDGPVGIAVDPGRRRVYWTTDRDYPRRLQRLRWEEGEIDDLVSGEDVNRPGAIVVGPDGDEIYWLESVSGRVRRAHADGSSIDELLEQRLLAGFGLALDDRAGALYWTDLANGVLQRGRLGPDGLDDVETLLTARDGLDAPTGLALDRKAGKLYFADAGSRTIRRCDTDGSNLETIVAEDDGLLDPRGLALDPRSGRLYVADAGSDSIVSVASDGTDRSTLVELDAAFGVIARERSGTAPDDCAAAVADAGARLARRLYVSTALCLDKVAFTKAVKWRAADMASAAATCMNQLGTVAGNRSGDARDMTRALRSALTAACAPRRASALVEPVASAPLLSADDGRICGAAADLDVWSRCVATAYERVAWEAVADDYPRTLEYLEEVRPFAERADGLPLPDDRRAEGLAGIDRVLVAVSEITGATRIAKVDGNPFPATGLITPYGADKNDGIAGPVPVPDDGSVRAGAPLRFVDNGDGTVSDLNTGLMWEKKCDDCGGLHDAMIGFRWTGDGSQETVWDWLDDVNSERGTGFAGYHDWRLPNAKELVSIVDYERFNPSVSRQFDAALCGLGCRDLKDPDCSCTAQGNYWTSTTFSDFPAHAYVVSFHLGLIADQPKTDRFFVRAVRGGPKVAY